MFSYHKKKCYFVFAMLSQMFVSQSGARTSVLYGAGMVGGGGYRHQTMSLILMGRARPFKSSSFLPHL